MASRLLPAMVNDFSFVSAPPELPQQLDCSPLQGLASMSSRGLPAGYVGWGLPVGGFPYDA